MVEPAPSPAERTARIAALNDALRENIHQIGTNRILMTQGIAALIGDTTLFRGFRQRAELIVLIREFNTFAAENDPYSEHDFGSFVFLETECFWKIDYYDETMEFGSEDPAIEEKTIRVLTIMTAREY
ncbi:DUF3768 domain-containing protein (plasmid) [Sphingomonas paeninsulae]|uniref:DUF3768 domain-containing protein n=1 Tax=Sphingomonas paeninsulae TaxID=2319844 RepID=A0A494TFS7_SPHPE|nr:DUF3768 domain-containing protein [Sphingomonas paeninsulae]AYJ84691.1 DUF3768 domain-containing protein [Sphingomonas paeninsulae]